MKMDWRKFFKFFFEQIVVISVYFCLFLVWVGVQLYLYDIGLYSFMLFLFYGGLILMISHIIVMLLNREGDV